MRRCWTPLLLACLCTLVAACRPAASSSGGTGGADAVGAYFAGARMFGRAAGFAGAALLALHRPGQPLSIVVQDGDLGISRGHNKIPVRVRTVPGGWLRAMGTGPSGGKLLHYEMWSLRDHRATTEGRPYPILVNARSKSAMMSAGASRPIETRSDAPRSRLACSSRVWIRGG